MPSSEFVIWKVYLEDEINERTPIIYHLLLIAKEIRQSYTPRSKSGKFVKWWSLSDLFLTLTMQKSKRLNADQAQTQPDELQTPTEVSAAKMNRSKSIWKGYIFGSYKRQQKNKGENQ